MRRGGSRSRWTMTLDVAGRTFRSRLIVGTGKGAPSRRTPLGRVEASGAEIVTVAVRRVKSRPATRRC